MAQDAFRDHALKSRIVAHLRTQKQLSCRAVFTSAPELLSGNQNRNYPAFERAGEQLAL